MEPPVLILVHRVPCDRPPRLSLALTAEERTRSHHRFDHEQGTIFLRLPRGTVLQDGDCLASATGEVIQITAKAESVLTVRAETTAQLLQAAYHLGNRHVALEIGTDYLRLLSDPVLKTLLNQLGVTVLEESVPFCPEVGAYHPSH